jgi:hypothetical protein
VLSDGGTGAAVYGASLGSNQVTVNGTAQGGNGGNSDGSGGLAGAGASVSLLSNGGSNDAVGGSASYYLTLNQTAIGGNGGTGTNGAAAGAASSILVVLQGVTNVNQQTKQRTIQLVARRTTHWHGRST